jgi:hypothetical protein
MAYNEAITETNNQQMLMVLVHNRYEETHSLLAVSSVTANVSATSSAAIQAGFGSSDSYDGNLVPFSGGFVYEENPTISYSPVSGETYLRQLMSPVPIPVFAHITHSMPYPEYSYDMLLSSVNGIRSPAFLFGSQQEDPRFERFVVLMTDLTHSHSLHWSRGADDPRDVTLVLEPETQKDRAMTAELLALLGLEGLNATSERLVIPVFLAISDADHDGIGIVTRTIHELVEISSAAVQVPDRDQRSGVAAAVPRPGRAGRQLKIYYSEDRPERAYVMLEYRDGWFFIDEADQATKRYFKLLGSLWSSAMAETLGNKAASPVLTVPVSR